MPFLHIADCLLEARGTQKTYQEDEPSPGLPRQRFYPVNSCGSFVRIVRLALVIVAYLSFQGKSKSTAFIFATYRT